MGVESYLWDIFFLILLSVDYSFSNPTYGSFSTPVCTYIANYVKIKEMCCQAEIGGFTPGGI